MDLPGYVFGVAVVRHAAAVPLTLALTAGCAQQDGTTEPAAAAAPAEVAAEPPVREIANVTGDLYRARSDNHYTVFLVTPEGVILGDPINTGFAEWLKAELANRFDAVVSHVVYSHHHWDHASGGAVFADTATFIGHEAMATALAAPLPGNAAPLDAFYADMLTVTQGGRTVELIHPGPAHSDDMTVLLFPEERAAFVVDYVNVRRLPGSLTGTTFDEYAAAIGAIQALDIDTVLPGHGEAGIKEDLAEYAAFLEDVRADVATGIAEGLSLEQLQETVMLEPYAGWLLYDDRRANLVSEAYTILTAR